MITIDVIPCCHDPFSHDDSFFHRERFCRHTHQRGDLNEDDRCGQAPDDGR